MIGVLAGAVGVGVAGFMGAGVFPLAKLAGVDGVPEVAGVATDSGVFEEGDLVRVIIPI
jgi:hypothetical protein